MSVPNGGYARRSMLLSLGLGLQLAVGCSDSTRPLAPSPVSHTPSGPTAATTVVVYEGLPDIYDALSRYHQGQLTSRYVLFGDSTFALEFGSPRFGSFAYTGRYKRVNSRIVFSWNAWSAAGPWGAEATLSGDSLKVTYNLVMMMSDFIDGTYVRAASTP